LYGHPNAHFTCCICYIECHYKNSTIINNVKNALCEKMCISYKRALLHKSHKILKMHVQKIFLSSHPKISVLRWCSDMYIQCLNFTERNTFHFPVNPSPSGYIPLNLFSSNVLTRLIIINLSYYYSSNWPLIETEYSQS